MHIAFILEKIADAFRRWFIVPRRERQFARLTDDIQHRTRDGLWFMLRPGDLISREVFLNGLYERPFLMFAKNHLRKQRTMLDVGANVGNHSIFLSRIFKHICAFEPNPTALGYLHSNKKRNQSENLTIYEVGLGREDAAIPFLEDHDGNLGKSQFVHEKDQEQTGGTLPTLPIKNGDKLVQKNAIENIDFIKIDVEGFEPDVLAGLGETISKHRPVIAFEFHGQDQGTDAYEALEALLPGYKFYEPFFWLEPGWSVWQKISYRLRHGQTPRLKEIGVPELRTYENIIALRDENQVSDVLFETA